MSESKKIRIVLEIDVRCMTLQEQTECWGGEEPDPELLETELPDAGEIAECVAGSLNVEEAQQEMFAGSDLYVKLNNARYVEAAYA